MVGRDQAGRDGENEEKEEGGGNAGEIATYHFHLGQHLVTAFLATLLPQHHLNLPPSISPSTHSVPRGFAKRAP